MRPVLRQHPDPQAIQLRDVSTGPRPGGKENRRIPGGLAKNKGRKAYKKGKRSRAWVFTENTIPDDASTKLLRAIQSSTLEPFGIDVRYITFQRERGAEANQDHFQGYVEFHRPYGISGVKSRVSQTAHWEIRGGSQAQAIKYCHKADTRVDGPFEYGEKASPGTRTDIHSLRDAIRSGSTKRQLYDDHTGTIAKYPRFAEGCKDAYFEHGWRKVECHLLIGPTRLGKTRWVYDNWGKERFWQLPAIVQRLWFDGYDGETHVLIDDFAGNCPIEVLLQLLDGYKIRLPRKGGFVCWSPTHIAVTTNVHPNEWYNWKGKRSQYDALAARFHVIKEYFGVGAYFEHESSDFFVPDFQ